MRLILSTSASTRLMVGMLSRAAAHQHDALDDVVVVVVAGDAEPRQVADRDGGDVADQHRRALVVRRASCCGCRRSNGSGRRREPRPIARRS